MIIDDFTMVIPTYNRPRMLAGALANYTRQGADFRITVVDSSAAEIQVQNAEAIATCPGRVMHVRLEPQTSVQQKFYSLPDAIQTPFGMYMADDDIAILHGVFASLAFLRARPDFVACHGTYYSAALCDEQTVNVGTEYATVSIDLPAPVDRLFALAVRYQAITYAVARRETFLAARPPLEVESPHFWELFNACAIVIAGKVAAIEAPYMIRNAQLGNQVEFLGDGNNWMLHESAVMGRAYVDFRERFEPLLARHSGPRNVQHIMDLFYFTFMARQYDLPTIARKLEADGDLSRGAALVLEAFAARKNAAAPPPDFVPPILREFMQNQWPRFG